MAEYPIDVKIDQDDRNIFLDGTGDLATISGLRNLEQSVAILTMEATRQFIGQRITGSSVGLLEERVRQAINNDPQIEEIVDVEVDEFDRGTDTVVMEVTTVENETFELPVTV